ncbi:ABC transporter ATP-binding protein [Rhodococcus hoagii]|nr:ABC transporter ATP-binding protein [Prescottella equi]
MRTNTNLAVEVTALTKSYGDRRVLDDVSLSVRRGSRTLVLGPNGAGKSTLLEVICTLRTPTSGTVRVDGLDAAVHGRDVRRLIGLTPQSNALDPMATPVEVLDFQAAALGAGRAAARTRTRELVELFGLGEHRNTRIDKLSGGTRRKVDLAVALVGEPPVVILDEPTTGLDPLSRMEFWDELKRLNDDGRTLLISTQDLHEAEVLATDIVVLRAGRVAAHDAPDTLKRRVGDRTLTLGLADAAAADRLVAGTRAGFHAVPDASGTVRLALPRESAALEAALREIGAVARDVEEIRLTEPSLDDVFVALATA